MKNNFWKSGYHEIIYALKNLPEIEILEEVMVAEANVLLCKFRDKRFNIYFDLEYGAELKAVDKIEQEELKHIEELILAEVK